MPHFQITGWDPRTLSVAVNKTVPLLEHLAEESAMLCLEAHFRDLDAVKRLAEVIPSHEFACYCWSEFPNSREFDRPEFQKLSQAQVVFENASVLFGPRDIPQPYDWDGHALDEIVLTLELRSVHRAPREDHDPSAAVTKLFADAARNVLGHGSEGAVKTTSIYRNEIVAHQYTIIVPSKHAATLASELSVTFRLRNGVGSYEFLGTPAELEILEREGHYHFSGFPAGCWNLNAPLNTRFALARQSFLRPVLNVTAAQLRQAATVLDSLGDRIARCAVVRKYLAWRLRGNKVSPRTQGNYIFISQQKAGYAIFVGFEQYADTDPSVKEFTAAAAPMVESLGATLKKVSMPR
jgi:hypothetical protein